MSFKLSLTSSYLILDPFIENKRIFGNVKSIFQKSALAKEFLEKLLSSKRVRQSSSYFFCSLKEVSLWMEEIIRDLSAANSCFYLKKKLKMLCIWIGARFDAFSSGRLGFKILRAVLYPELYSICIKYKITEKVINFANNGFRSNRNCFSIKLHCDLSQTLFSVYKEIRNSRPSSYLTENYDFEGLPGVVLRRELVLDLRRAKWFRLYSDVVWLKIYARMFFILLQFNFNHAR